VTTPSRRPVFLNLTQIRLPAPGLLSIGHRISGVVLILSIPIFSWLLGLSLSGTDGFARSQAALESTPVRLLLLLLAWGLLHHLFAGIRYLALDLNVGVDKAVARASAWGVLVGAPVAAILLGVML
jgi:succinate dehydrogenase / fumarate reductase cytochrome b subunit